MKDFNGDTLDDLIAIAFHTPDLDDSMFGPTPGIYLMLGNLRSSLGPVSTIHSDLTILGRRVAIGDVNGDGLADLALAANTPNRGSVSIYQGTRDGLGASPTIISDLSGVMIDAVSIAITDFNGDGFGDLLVFNFRDWVDSRPWLRVYLGAADGISPDRMRGTSLEAARLDYDQNNQSGDLGDLDGDGYGDVGFMRFGGSSQLLFGNASGDPGARVLAGEFAIRTRKQVGIFSADINGDSIPDLLMSYPRRVARGFGGALIQVQALTSESPTIDSATRLYDRSRLSRPADYDGDGYPDLVETTLCSNIARMGECGLTELRYFRNRGGYLPTDPDWRTSATTSTFAGSPGDLNGDGFDDLVVADGTRLTVYLGAVGMLERQSGVFTTDAPVQHGSLLPLL